MPPSSLRSIFRTNKDRLPNLAFAALLDSVTDRMIDPTGSEWSKQDLDLASALANILTKTEILAKVGHPNYSSRIERLHKVTARDESCRYYANFRSRRARVIDHVDGK